MDSSLLEPELPGLKAQLWGSGGLGAGIFQLQNEAGIRDILDLAWAESGGWAA